MDLGERIRALRKRKYTQEELAELVKVHVNTVIRWERGDRTPDAERLRELAKVLNTSTAYLLGETDDPTRVEALSAQESRTQASADTPQTEAAQDLDRLIRELASKNPDLIIRLRSTVQSLDELSDEAKQAIADGLKYVLGLAELDDLPRLKRDSGKGLI